ncbi:hypothetical protein D5b_00356 [Faustovirus]|nr:hypothetical protein D5b_00356 [Faustovirus]AMN84557.1 hypothetical protein D6_00151 [Faustovirus]AMP44300.1 hypothetical protein PRJ_Dakar_00348 [Faustovirus]QKE50256.1 hypothetical protein F-VV10_0136 [Faustovirus]
MDYRLADINRQNGYPNINILPPLIGKIERNAIKPGFNRMGEMPADLIMSKFEETNTEDFEDETTIVDYNRRMITDRTPDQNLFADEEPTGRKNERYGRLQLQYYGHRGDAEPPAHSEIFQDFAGPEWHDPRGTFTDPDFKNMRSQEAGRMRFKRFTSDSCDQVTGGGVSEFQAMQRRVLADRMMKPRLKIFSTSFDGRREGLRRSYNIKTPFNDVVLQQSYGDKVLDWALNPQRKTTILSNTEIRNSKWYQQNTTDHEFKVQKYGDLPRKALRRSLAESQVWKQANNIDLSDSNLTKCYKVMGMMANAVVMARKDQIAAMKLGDTDYASQMAQMSGKHAPLRYNIAATLREVNTDGQFNNSAQSWMFKTNVPKLPPQLMDLATHSHTLPEHQLHGACMAYKTVAEASGKAKRDIMNDAIDDAAKATQTEDMTVSGKNVALKLLNNKTAVMRDTEYGIRYRESMKTANYKQAKLVREQKLLNYNGEAFKLESNDTPTRKNKSPVGQVNGAIEADTVDNMRRAELGDNFKQERHGGKLGSKYTRRNTVDEITRDDMSNLN